MSFIFVSYLDIYWENVGGETLDAVLVNANNFSRIVACGMISTYGNSEPYGVKNLMNVISKRIRFEGFVESDLEEKYCHVSSSLFIANLGFSSGCREVGWREKDQVQGRYNSRFGECN